MPLSTQVYKWVPAKCWGVTLRWTSIPSRGEQKYSQSLHAIETGISSGLMGHYARRQTLPLPFSYFDRPKYDCTRKLKKAWTLLKLFVHYELLQVGEKSFCPPGHLLQLLAFHLQTPCNTLILVPILRGFVLPGEL